MTQTTWQERRLRVVHLDYFEVLDFFVMAIKGWPRCVMLPRLTGLPADVQVVDVREEPHRRVFAFLVAHPSFPVVPPGEPVPPFLDPIARSVEVIELPAPSGQPEARS